MFNFKLWVKGLMAAAIGGASTAAIDALSNPTAVEHPKQIATMAGVGAALTGLAYLKKHPPVDKLPDEFEPIAAAGIVAAVGRVEKKIGKKR